MFEKGGKEGEEGKSAGHASPGDVFRWSRDGCTAYPFDLPHCVRCSSAAPTGEVMKRKEERGREEGEREAASVVHFFASRSRRIRSASRLAHAQQLPHEISMWRGGRGGDGSNVSACCPPILPILPRPNLTFMLNPSEAPNRQRPRERARREKKRRRGGEGRWSVPLSVCLSVSAS